MRFTFLSLALLVGCSPAVSEPESVRPASAAPPELLCAYVFEAPEPTAGTLEHPETDRDCTLPDGSADFKVGFRYHAWWLTVHVPRTRNGQWTDGAHGMRAVAEVADELCTDFDGRARAYEENGRWRLDLDLVCQSDPAIALRGVVTN
jgi:hypothetical protein